MTNDLSKKQKGTKKFLSPMKGQSDKTYMHLRFAKSTVKIYKKNIS